MKKLKGQDADLRQMLLRNDPAGVVSHDDNARLEMFIADRIFYQPQPQLHARHSADLFLVPHYLAGKLSWTATLTGTMIMGLMLGFFAASFSDERGSNPYNISAYDISGPWQHLVD